MKRKPSNRLYKLPIGYDRTLNIVLLLLSIFGVIMQTSASMSSSNVTMFALLKTFAKQLAIFVISYAAYIFFSNYFNFDRFKSNISNWLVFSVIFLVLPLCFSSSGGSHAWIKIPLINFSIQPAEFCKMIIILMNAIYLGDAKREKVGMFYHFKMPFITTLIYVVIIAFFQSDMGSAIILGLISAVVMLVPSNKSLRYAQFLIAIGLIGFVLLMIFLTTDTGTAFLSSIKAMSYQIVRFKAANNPFTNRYGTGYYDLVNSLIAFNSGGIFGVGLGKSLRKYGYLSAGSTDFIMAVIVEELGILGFLFVAFAYLFLIITLFKHALNTKNDRDKVTIIGVAMYFILHFIFNIGGITCLIPLTGIPLLLISSGGSSSLSCMIALGIVQNIISRSKKDVTDAENY